MTMKKFLLSVFAGLTTVTMLAGCSQQAAPSGSQASSASSSSSSPSSQSQPSSTASSGSESSGAPSSQTPAPSESAPVPTEPEGGKTLVLYFSASGNTRAVAETIAEAADAEVYELTPAEP